MLALRVCAAPILLTLVSAGCGEPTQQPLAFNHLAHKEAGVDCNVCHEHFETSTYSGLPKNDTCTMCHQGDGDAPALQQLARYVAQGQEIPWKRLYGVPLHVYYSHRRHVVSGKIACAECHGPVGDLAEPPAYALVHQSMEWCVDCHEKRGASNDCIHCHR